MHICLFKAVIIVHLNHFKRSRLFLVQTIRKMVTYTSRGQSWSVQSKLTSNQEKRKNGFKEGVLGAKIDAYVAATCPLFLQR